jgi:hypothetical protein
MSLYGDNAIVPIRYDRLAAMLISSTNVMCFDTHNITCRGEQSQ